MQNAIDAGDAAQLQQLMATQHQYDTATLDYYLKHICTRCPDTTNVAECASVLVCAGASPSAIADNEGNTLLCEAIHRKKTLIALAIIESPKTDLHAKCEDESTAMHAAASMFNSAVLQALLARGASVNPRDKCENTPLHYSLMNETTDQECKDVIKALKEKGGTHDFGDESEA